MSRAVPALAVLLLPASLALGGSHIFDVARLGQTREANGLAISGGHAYARQRSPAVTFGTVRPPSGKRQLTYVVLSKSGGKVINLPQVTCDLDVSGSEATDRSTIAADGKKLALVYKARIDHGKVASEDLSVNGKGLDLHSGRVLLVDFTRDATWTQVKADLPDSPEDLANPESLTSTGSKLLQQLRADPAVQAFFK